MNKPFQIILLILFSSNILLSQAFKPIDTLSQENYKNQKISFFEVEKQNKINSLKKELSGSNKRETVKIYNSVYDNYIRSVKNREYINYPKFYDYIKLIISEISSSNNQYNFPKTNFFISRDLEPNVYSGHDGILIFNYNFLNYLDSEDELASIICHELSHQLLKHTEKSIEFQVKKTINDSVKAEQNRIKNLEYNKSSASQNFLKEWIYEKQKLKRKHEIEADSLGFVLFKNTKYKQIAYYNILKKLENIDIEKDSLTKEDYKKIFPVENFKNDWFETDDSSKYFYSKEHYFKWDIDSLKTHPSIKERLTKFKLTDFKDNNDNFSVDAKIFNNLKTNAEKEIIFSTFYDKKYGISLYRALILFRKENDTLFAKEMIYKNLEKLESEKKQKRYGQYIIPINSFEQSKSQQLFYTFFDNITTNDIISFKNIYKNK